MMSGDPHPQEEGRKMQQSPGMEGSSSNEGWEERYNKLKALTLKYKKKIAEQTSEIEGLKGHSGLQNASKIQQEYDKALDEIERLKKTEKALQKDLQKAIDENVSLKMKEAETTAEMSRLTSSHKMLRDKLERFEKEEGNVEELKSKVERLEKELQETRDVTADSHQDKRLLQILTLEVTDYEKKLQDAHGQLEGKKVECDKLLTEIGEKDKRMKQLVDTVGEYKETENQLILARESLQADAVRKQEKIVFLQDEIGKLNERLSEKKGEVEKLNQELDTTKTTFTSQCQELSDKLGVSQKTVSHLEQKISLLEENKRSRESQITNMKLEMQQLESEYHNYKSKAQAMLKSQKPTSFIDGDEMEKMQRTIQDFQSEVSILKSDLRTHKLENENLMLERADSNVRLNQLRADSIEKEMQLNSEIQKMKEDMRKKQEQFAAQLEAKSSEAEQISSSWKSELQAVRAEYEQQIQYLREQCEVLKAAASDHHEAVSTGVSTDNDSLEGLHEPDGDLPQNHFRPIAPVPLARIEGSSESYNKITHPLTIDTSSTAFMGFDHIRMMPRGEGEGSESVASIPAYKPRRDSYNLTFEQLLSTSFESISKGSDSDKDRTIRESMQTELIRCQSQIAHLTSVLRESESNCDRLAQLSDALKEEIRRIERDKERQEHLKENTEYLKNVVIKFVTLTGEDERQRLIPVLKTMLRLTSEEVGKLETIVNGKTSGHTSKEAASASGGWSSYLPLWSGGGTG